MTYKPGECFVFFFDNTFLHLSSTRQAGLGALAGAIGSDLFYSSTYSEQLSEIVPALLVNIDANKFASNSELRSEADKITDSSEASNAEYAAKRRIASARTVPAFSVDAEKPLPDNATSSAAMGSLFTLVHHGDASHVQGFVGALLDFLNGKTSNARHWEHKDWCCWIVQSVCSWTNLQYRFIIPTTLVDYLVDDSNSPTENKHHTLIAMIASVLGGKLSIIGLSTSDTANSLLGFAVRRVHNDSKDPVLPPLVKCIAALGTHIYYADQLNDLAEEITARIASLEIPDATEQDANPVPYTERKSARESIRMLLACLLRLMDTAQKSSGEVQKGWERKDKSLSVQGAGTRSRISTSVWHQTTSLLASPDYAVRYSLEEVLSAFFKTEAQPSSLDSNDPLSDTLGSKLSVEATGFTHSFSAALYVLTLSKVLYAPNTAKDSPLEALPAIDRSNKERQLELSSPSATALPIDFSALIQILDGMYERIPVAAILGTVPALLAINKSAANVPAGPRRDAIDTLVQSSLNKIASVAGISSLSSSVSNNLPTFPNADKPETFDDLASSHPAKSGNVKADSVISSLSNSSKLQAATDLDSKALQNWFARDWSVQIAVDDSFVGASPFKLVDDDASLPVNATPRNSERGGVVTNVLGASPSKSNGAGFGVDEFRQALGTRSANKANQNKTEYNSLNGGLSLPETALDKRASRRASRKISQPIKSSSNGNASPHSVGGLLDSMRVGLPEEDTDSSPQGRVAVPYAP